MVTHEPILRAPWYADASDGTLLHRYLQDDFVETFIQEAQQEKLTANRHQAWIAADKFGAQHPRLRLPLQRAFYMVATEAVCNLPGKPAFTPKKIIAAGFVVRKKNKSGLQLWRLRDGKALGWQSPSGLDLTQDPDLAKRNALNPLLKIRGIKPIANTATGFSGEQTYPLHARVVHTEQGPRTLLFGYLPLNGQREVEESTNQQAAGQTVSAAGYLAELEWPFGSWDGLARDTALCNCTGSLQDVIQKMCNQFGWDASLHLQIKNGVPTRAFGRLLALLVNRYQIGDATIADNDSLRALLQSMPIFTRLLSAQELVSMRQNFPLFIQQARQQNIIRTSLLGYLQEHSEIVSRWYNRNEARMAQGRNEDKTHQNSTPGFDALENFNGHLYITEVLAQTWRAQMLARAEQINNVIEAALPLPRYTQGKDETYFVQPFMRYRDECECEKVCWGQPSFEFTVASPFDTQTVRPSVIQLPELRDIKKGMAKGVTFLTPKSVADLMLKIAPTMEMKEQQSRSPLDACLGFSISFSIPIITICAMILLMIVLNLLNLIFRWLPYAILILPRLCLPRVNVNGDNP